MKRDVALADISDGRLYGLQDMVRADCQDCKGCSDCCHGMGQSVVLDPYDIYRMQKQLGKSCQELLANGSIELNVVDGLVLPNLKMAGEDEACGFLDTNGRCTIHAARPGICRLFPLGRYYENGTFQYFLQIHECSNRNRSKIKVHKWIDTPAPEQYDAYILWWHDYLEQQRKLITGENANEISISLLKKYYLLPYNTAEDFYLQLQNR